MVHYKILIFFHVQVKKTYKEIITFGDIEIKEGKFHHCKSSIFWKM